MRCVKGRGAWGAWGARVARKTKWVSVVVHFDRGGRSFLRRFPPWFVKTNSTQKPLLQETHKAVFAGALHPLACVQSDWGAALAARARCPSVVFPRDLSKILGPELERHPEDTPSRRAVVRAAPSVARETGQLAQQALIPLVVLNQCEEQES